MASRTTPHHTPPTEHTTPQHNVHTTTHITCAQPCQHTHHTYTYTYTQTYTHKHVHIHIPHTHTHTHTRTHISTHIHTPHIHIHIHVHIYVPTHTHTHARTHTHTTPHHTMHNRHPTVILRRKSECLDMCTDAPPRMFLHSINIWITCNVCNFMRRLCFWN